ncbi:MAG: hypothetical protein Q8Q20_03065 [bacterium]|nr:hypothetical protein [bacterium]
MKVFIFLLVYTLSIWQPVEAASVELYYFYDPDCLACDSMTDSLAVMSQEYPELRVISRDISADETHLAILQDLFRIYDSPERSVPAVFVGTQSFVGHNQSVVLAIEQELLSCRNGDCPRPSEALTEYYDLVSENPNSASRLGWLAFWSVFILIWPLVGAIAIYKVWKKKWPKRKPARIQ